MLDVDTLRRLIGRDRDFTGPNVRMMAAVQDLEEDLEPAAFIIRISHAIETFVHRCLNMMADVG